MFVLLLAMELGFSLFKLYLFCFAVQSYRVQHVYVECGICCVLGVRCVYMCCALYRVWLLLYLVCYYDSQPEELTVF